MTKLTLLSRAAATAAAALFGPCAVLLAWPLAAAAAKDAHRAHKVPAGAHKSAATILGAGENQPLHLGSPTTTSHVSSGGASLVRTIVGLAIVIGVIWGLSWILRQVKAGRDPQLPSTGLASIAALTLGSGRSVHLVRAGSEYVLLGSAEHGLVPIHRYSEQEARDAGLLPAPEPSERRRRKPLLAPPRQQSAGHDPMRMGSPNSALLDRVREWTVRR